MMAAIGMPKRAAVLLLLVTSAAGAPGDSSSDDSTNVYCDECGASATYARWQRAASHDGKAAPPRVF